MTAASTSRKRVFDILFRSAVTFVLSYCAVLGVAAQENTLQTTNRLEGTLKKIRSSGVVRLGHRVSSIPFAYLDGKSQPVGYSIELCNAIVDKIASELGNQEIRVEYVPVTPESRFDALVSGQIDMECGSTTDNNERRKQVAFSPTIFVTGTKLLARKDSAVQSLHDLQGRTVVVTRGTSNASAVQSLSTRWRLGLSFLTVADHKEAFELLASGKADAIANDDILLYGLLAETKNRDRYRIVGDFLSYEPYALVFRKDDPQFAQVVERTFQELAASREIVWIYERWFVKRLPSGTRLNLPMSAQLEAMFHVLGLPEN
jgi:glutamate/aspartate transport system substrate-binding protein